MISPTSESIVNHAWLELTYACNLECTHCYTNSGPYVTEEKPLSILEYKAIIESLAELGCKSIQFIGGEPTLNRNLNALILISKDSGIKSVEVYTNFTHVSDALWHTFKNNGVSIATSLYAADARIHDSITRKNGSHAKTVSNIRKAVELGIPVRAGMVITQLNASCVSDTASYARELGINAFRFDKARSIGRLEKARGKEAQTKELCGRCTSGNICIGPQGGVSPCIMSKEWSVGSTRSDGLRQIVDRSLVEIRKSMNFAFEHSRSNRFAGDCNPEDHCGPGACGPQFDGDEDCFPHTECPPIVLGEEDDE